jgi:hypothetical protein
MICESPMIRGDSGCYALSRFPIGLVYDAKHNVITEVRSFKYGHSLDKYTPKF